MDNAFPENEKIKPRAKETILFVFRSCGNLAGTERVLLNWCKFIDHNKIDIFVCAHKGSFWNIYNQIVPYVHLIDFQFDNKLHNSIVRFTKTVRFLKKLNATKVVWMLNGMDGFYLTDILASFIATKGNIYISHHNFLIPYEKVKPRLWFGFISGIGLWRIKKIIHWRFIHLISKRVLSVSEAVREPLISYWKIPKYKIRIACHGVDTNIFFPDSEARSRLKNKLNISNDTKIFIALNRFESQKRIDRLLGAFLKLLRDKLNVCLLVIGDGSLKYSFLNRITRNSLLKERVKIFEFQKEVAPFLRGADFLLLVSDYEGEGNVIKEAMACGVIPISTDSYGPRGIKGTIFLSKRDVFSFYEKIKEVLSLSSEKSTSIRRENIKIIREIYELSKCAPKEVSAFDVPLSLICQKLA